LELEYAEALRAGGAEDFGLLVPTVRRPSGGLFGVCWEVSRLAVLGVWSVRCQRFTGV
jgi:hypothetical protein